MFAERFHSLIRGETRGIYGFLARRLLWFASCGYGAAMEIRNRLFDLGWKKVHRVEVPVISVGNLTLGGTGKTPCVEYLATFFRRQDVMVAILSRGYGASHGRNDEALVLEANLPDVPHLQNPDRWTIAQTAIEELDSELLILDDGFQHRRLARCLDIVLIDATLPFGYNHLFPRGLLREPVRALHRADIVLLTRCDQVEETTLREIAKRIQQVRPTLPIYRTRHQPVCLQNSQQQTWDLNELKHHPVAAFAGIGNPGAFFATLRRQGADLIATRVYADHHPYQRDDVAALHQWADTLPPDTRIVTTQKDLVKLRLQTLCGRPLYALRISLAFMDSAQERELHHRLLAVLDSSVETSPGRLQGCDRSTDSD